MNTDTLHAIPTLDRRRAAALFGDDTGAATAEYAITTMATVAGLGHKSECRRRSLLSRAGRVRGHPEHKERTVTEETNETPAEQTDNEVVEPWSPESDPDGITRDDVHMKDWVLSTFIDMIAGPDDHNRGSASLTVQSNGATITGMLISADEYFENVADAIRTSGAEEFADAIAEMWGKLRADSQEWRDERASKDLPTPSRRYVHMRDVSILSGSAIIKAPNWRGTLEDITGWSTGSYSFDN